MAVSQRLFRKAYSQRLLRACFKGWVKTQELLRKSRETSGWYRPVSASRSCTLASTSNALTPSTGQLANSPTRQVSTRQLVTDISTCNNLSNDLRISRLAPSPSREKAVHQKGQDHAKLLAPDGNPRGCSLW
ncbi:hypothetical protein E4U27_005907 [Claviceps purpurea]|nr:hypothetical protein E4U27_005907 [Claviceps purpurea]